MKLTYQNYPLLLFLSYDKNDAPEALPFQAESKEAKDYLETATGLHELFGYLGVKNSVDNKKNHSNYLITNELFYKIDSDLSFRNSHFATFFSTYIKPKTGTILFKDGGQYAFMLLEKHETKVLMRSEGRYMAAALFKENIFLGFEEAIVTEQGLQVLHTGYYEGIDLGGYLSFVTVFLVNLHYNHYISALY